ncbi:uncharacterized protein [Penaeus vannamei]|uniref:uncharacterized protein n=1 Tax=Penaeus vannamei TaxID=6689 RepID=UPI00387F6F0F
MMKNGKAVGPDNLPVENKGDIMECGNNRGIKLMSHSMKLYERVQESRLRKIVEISEEQFGFMKGKSTTDAIFVLRQLQEKFRKNSTVCLLTWKRPMTGYQESSCISACQIKGYLRNT